MYILTDMITSKKVRYIQNAIYIYNRIDINKKGIDPIRYYLGIITACVRMYETCYLIMDDPALKTYIYDYIIRYKNKADCLSKEIEDEILQRVKGKEANKELFRKWNCYFENDSHVSSPVS